MAAQNLDEFVRFEHDGNTYYALDQPGEGGDIPELTLLSGFDPLIVSYAERSAVLPREYKSAVILKSGICLPSIAVHGRVAGLWNLKKGQPTLEFFADQPRRIVDQAHALVEGIRWQTSGII